jgi:hypothetical protein
MFALVWAERVTGTPVRRQAADARIFRTTMFAEVVAHGFPFVGGMNTPGMGYLTSIVSCFERCRYEVKDGIFKRLCRRAQQDPAQTYTLVIDEINRGNISKVCRGKTACGFACPLLVELDSSDSASAS